MRLARLGLLKLVEEVDAPTTTLGRESLLALFHLGDVFTGTHVSVVLQLERI